MIRPRSVSIDDFLTEAEIARALELYEASGPGGAFNRAVVAEIIEPNLPRINATLGQENDPRFLGYAVEYVFSNHGKIKGRK